MHAAELDLTVLVISITSIWLAFWLLLDRSRLLEIYVAFLFAGVVAYLFCDLGVAYGLWSYPTDLTHPDNISTLKNLLIFPPFGAIFYQYLTDNKHKDILLALLFALFNTGTEILIQRYTDILAYSPKMNYLITFTVYFIAYLLVMLHRFIYHKLSAKEERRK